ncbi:MAG: MgtC/SapB family protein [Methanocella sp.]
MAVLLGAIVGLEREAIHKPVDLRTHMLVSLGSWLMPLTIV